METAILALAGSGATTAGTSAALGATTGVATASQVATTAPVLLSAGGTAAAGGFGALGVFSSLQAGRYQAAAYKSQSRQGELAARAEELRGRDQADKIKRTLQATLASQNAAFGSRMVALGSGTPRSIASLTNSEASADISRAQFGAGYGAAVSRAGASEARMAGRQAAMQGYIGAATSLIQTAKAASSGGAF